MDVHPTKNVSIVVLIHTQMEETWRNMEEHMIHMDDPG